MFQLPIGPPAPLAECPHSPYTDFDGGLCQNRHPHALLLPLQPRQQGLTPVATVQDPSKIPVSTHHTTYANAGGTFDNGAHTCMCPATGPETCPPPQGSTQTAAIACLSAVNIGRGKLIDGSANKDSSTGRNIGFTAG